MAAGCKFRLLCSESFDFGHRRKFKKNKNKVGGEGFMTKRKDESAIAAAVAANEEGGEGKEGEEEAEEGRKRNRV